MVRVKTPSLLLAKLPQEGGRSSLRIIFMQKSFRILEELKGNNGFYENKGGGGCVVGTWGGVPQGLLRKEQLKLGSPTEGKQGTPRYLGLEEDTEPQT